LASQGFTVWANDFSEKAVEDARGRSQMYLSQIEYQVVDLTNPWPYNYETVDAIFDCETTIYIPEEGRTAAIQSAFKTLKKGGYYFFYGIAEHTSHKDMSHTQQGYTEKRYTMEELTMAYSAFDVVSIETLEHHDHINGHDAIHTMWTAVFQKPLN
jgi:2-polyprenyl-3-methyl-5-hydroxy-6-metoxy-1,4-benzoquinol methylase